MLRIIIKIFLFPVTILLSLLGWLCSTAIAMSGIAFRLIAGALFLFAFLGYGFGLETWSGALRMILGGVIFLAIPTIAVMLVEGIYFLKALLRMI